MTLLFPQVVPQVVHMQGQLLLVVHASSQLLPWPMFHLRDGVTWPVQDNLCGLNLLHPWARLKDERERKRERERGRDGGFCFGTIPIRYQVNMIKNANLTTRTRSSIPRSLSLDLGEMRTKKKPRRQAIAPRVVFLVCSFRAMNGSVVTRE